MNRRQRFDDAVARRFRAGGEELERLHDAARERKTRKRRDQGHEQDHEPGGRDFGVHAGEHLGAIETHGNARVRAGHGRPPENLRRADRIDVEIGRAHV